MNQQEGWTGGAYRYEFATVPDSNHKLRRTARKHARDLNRAYELRKGGDVQFTAEKAKRGPFGWHVVRRTRVPA
jgi:hypothetical protein